MTLELDTAQIRQAIGLLVEPGAVFEIRMPAATFKSDYRPFKRTVFGYFDNVEKLLQELDRVAWAEGIYMTLNPCPPALLARANNRWKAAEKNNKTTSDDNIKRRTWLPIDIDPVREDGVKGISATDEEQAAALHKLNQVTKWLAEEQRWPDPILTTSGNGAYAYYSISLPGNDDGLVQRVIAALAAQFNDETAEIDATTFNPARITRLPGTLNCKCDETDDRQYRMAWITYTPDEKICQVSQDQLERVAGSCTPPQGPSKTRQQQREHHEQEERASDEELHAQFNKMQAYIDQHQIELNASKLIMRPELAAE